MKKWLLGLSTGVFSLALVAGCGGSSSSPDTSSATPADGGAAAVEAGDVVAVVNGEEIPREEFDAQLEQARASYEQQGVPFPEGDQLAQLTRQVVTQLVQQELVIQEAESREITATDEEVQSEYEQTVASFQDEETFRQTLEAEGLSESDLQDVIEENLKVEKLLNSVVEEASVPPPSEEEIQQLYDEASQQQELPPLEEVRDQIEAQLRNEREGEVVQQFIQQLESSGDVEILI